jgi:hypothetical protein
MTDVEALAKALYESGVSDNRAFAAEMARRLAGLPDEEIA